MCDCRENRCAFSSAPMWLREASILAVCRSVSYSTRSTVSSVGRCLLFLYSWNLLQATAQRLLHVLRSQKALRQQPQIVCLNWIVQNWSTFKCVSQTRKSRFWTRRAFARLHTWCEHHNSWSWQKHPPSHERSQSGGVRLFRKTRQLE